MSEEKKLNDETLEGVTGGANGSLERVPGNTFEEKTKYLADQTNQQLMDFLQKNGENKP